MKKTNKLAPAPKLLIAAALLAAGVAAGPLSVAVAGPVAGAGAVVSSRFSPVSVTYVSPSEGWPWAPSPAGPISASGFCARRTMASAGRRCPCPPPARRGPAAPRSKCASPTRTTDGFLVPSRPGEGAGLVDTRRRPALVAIINPLHICPGNSPPGVGPPRNRGLSDDELQGRSSGGQERPHRPPCADPATCRFSCAMRVVLTIL